jgi:hypothetical protein
MDTSKSFTHLQLELCNIAFVRSTDYEVINIHSYQQQRVTTASFVNCMLLFTPIKPQFDKLMI